MICHVTIAPGFSQIAHFPGNYKISVTYMAQYANSQDQMVCLSPGYGCVYMSVWEQRASVSANRVEDLLQCQSSAHHFAQALHAAGMFCCQVVPFIGIGPQIV